MFSDGKLKEEKMRIWFNHWFSSVYNLIELIKNEIKNATIIGSSKQVNSVVKVVCDEWYEEPDEDENYVEYCLSFCKEHDIDIFVPRRNLELISKNLVTFNELGIKVLVDDYSRIKLLSDKQKTYEVLKDIKGINIPKYYVVENINQFDEAYKNLRNLGCSVCVKFIKDEGAQSYRRIIDEQLTFDRLRVYSRAEVFLEDYRRCLSEKLCFDKLMVMEYLPEKEISVDCMNTEQGVIIIPRYKTTGRDELINFNKSIIKVCEKIMKKIQLQYPCNIQFKKKNDVPYLLEINTRMSGGLYMSCLTTGINIPIIAIGKLCGFLVDWKLTNLSEKYVSYIEVPKLL